ncbi:hypothetical protein K0040_15725 [Terrisporobacter petrolearius]|uniref:hypothetical protein n=1 Tax=Terrisporobacter petrolearius TaxID=1460447 RepID=UPI0008E98817|nr:hypothetical protein [Terrisporobacter petrolearius]MCC3865711.1 hypothetical protein [Terrisporobacter petrolearius]SFJ51769.1 hypothetical protein SAMN02910355_2917 [Terrisporobacter glycolicus]
MFCNYDMKRLLSNIEYTSNDKNVKLIEKKCSIKGEYFYCIKEGFCLSCDNVNFVKDELSDFEWEGNEIYLYSDGYIDEVLKEALIIIEQLKVQMLNEFKKTSFDIVLSVDLGDEDVNPSATIRFYSVRDEYHIIEYDEIEEYNQPMLICDIVNK